MTPEQLQQLTTYPLYVLLLAGIITLWRAYNASQNARVDDLKQSYEKNLADLRTRVILLEDHAGIKVLNAVNSSGKAIPSIFDKKDDHLD